MMMKLQSQSNSFKKGDKVIYCGKDVKYPIVLYFDSAAYNPHLNRWDYYLKLSPKEKLTGYVGTDFNVMLFKG
jgi:hypothetical protein